jgi:trehalose 6-phosphate phosphatase
VTPPLPDAGASWALFLDFDGTLAELAEDPEQVRVGAERVALLERLDTLLDGAVAVISGRSIETLDRLLHPARPQAAGLHGMQLRTGDNAAAGSDGTVLAAARHALQEFATRHSGVLLEDKGGALALHYRSAPALREACRRAAEDAARGLEDHHVLEGKMVYELKPMAANKGLAISAFLEQLPFRDRRPVFAGDDRTDEDGFALVNAYGGVSIKVGAGSTQARYRVADVAALLAWLERLAECLERGRAG